ncbi:uncharacterized protein [Ptychodera flava]|uniref:uncharacterized protein n=1 Tax=Ptychodera flava TaxID=63121 RepID=UPI00396A40AA
MTDNTKTTKIQNVSSNKNITDQPIASIATGPGPLGLPMHCTPCEVRTLRSDLETETISIISTQDKLLRVSGKQYFHSPNRTVSSKRARELIKASLTQREYEGREEKLVSWIKEKFCQWRQEERRKILAKDNGMTKYGTMDTESLVISMCRNKRIKHDTVSMSEVALMRKFARSAYKEEDGDFFHQFKLFRTAENIIEINNDKREQIIAEDKQIDYSAGGFFREENDSQLSPTFPHPL